MKIPRSNSNYAFMLCLLVANLAPAQQAAPAPIKNSATETHENNAGLTSPENSTAYASESIGDGKLCVAGTVTDDDGMNQKPVVYAAGAESKRTLWIARLNLPPNTYQSRATHCNRLGNAVFVLLQSDTQPEQTLSQTLLRVVKLDVTSGAVQAQRDVDIPTAYTAWVDKGASHFLWQGNVLTISGNYRLKSDQNRQAPFTVRLNSGLNP